MKEIWKEIDGLDGKYMVSSMGNIKSLFFNKERLMIPQMDSCGYMRIRMGRGEIKNTYKIHRVVAKAFLPNPYNKETVNHINGIRHDNRAENLEWATRSENTIHSFKILGKKPPLCPIELKARGKNHSQSIPICQLDESTRGIVRIFESQGLAASTLKILQGNIRRAMKTGGRYAGYRWCSLKQYKNGNIRTINGKTR